MKVLKQLQYNKKLNRWFGSLNLKSTTKKLIKLSLTMFMIVHLSACFWYLAAKLMANDDSTWVSRKSTVSKDSSTMLLYFESVYWSTQVLTTVGYGDFGAGNTIEYLLNIVWMIIGVGFYQLAFGQITSIL